MAELVTATRPTEYTQTEPPAIEDVLGVVRRFNYHTIGLWTPHHDSQREIIGTEYVLNGRQAQYSRELEQNLDTLRAAEGQFDPSEYNWLPEPKDVVNHVVGAAESIRRSLSSDSYAMSDTLPQEEEPARDSPRIRKHFLHRTRAALRNKLIGKNESTVNDTVLHAEIRGDYRELTPLESRREYQEITPSHIKLLSQEEPAVFIKLSTDILSPIRNEHMPLSNESLSSLVALINERKDEVGSLSAILLINCWRLAIQNNNPGLALSIQSTLEEKSSLRHYMELYEHQEVSTPSQENMKRNATRYMGEYTEKGGSASELESKVKPKVRMRLKPEALWSIAMRDGGFIRSGDEGAVRKSGRGYEGSYADVRSDVENTLYGETALDRVEAVPIIYGYYANDETEQTVAMQSMARIYGGIELVFKNDISADKRIVYGDSMNAAAIAANGQPVTSELITQVLDERVIAEEDVPALAHVITALHGTEENTQVNPSANPYIECLLRGRLTLSDCSEIIVPYKIYDRNASLMAAIQEKFGVSITRGR